MTVVKLPIPGLLMATLEPLYRAAVAGKGALLATVGREQFDASNPDSAQTAGQWQLTACIIPEKMAEKIRKLVAAENEKGGAA